jgi:uncharacterized protein (DUF1684 family)
MRRFPSISPRFMGALVSLGLGWAVFGEEAPGAWRQWQQERREAVAGTNGWATVVGLFWLHEGTNSVGASGANEIWLPAGASPEIAGRFVRQGAHVRFESGSGVVARVAGQPIESADLISDEKGPPTRLALGRLQLFVIARGNRLGVRVRDPQAPNRTRFQGLEYFPWQTRWQIPARFVPYPAGHTLPISDVTGQTSDLACPGALVFTVAGQEFRLDALDDPEVGDLWILFRDGTNAKTTYGSGRFLHAPKPGSGDAVMLDFNRAYNPPCAFTGFATCPLAPRQNWLPFTVEAGEKHAGAGHP